MQQSQIPAADCSEAGSAVQYFVSAPLLITSALHGIRILCIQRFYQFLCIVHGCYRIITDPLCRLVGTGISTGDSCLDGCQGTLESCLVHTGI